MCVYVCKGICTNQIPKENNINSYKCVHFKKKGGTWAKNNKRRRSSRMPKITVEWVSKSL